MAFLLQRAWHDGLPGDGRHERRNEVPGRVLLAQVLNRLLQRCVMCVDYDKGDIYIRYGCFFAASLSLGLVPPIKSEPWSTIHHLGAPAAAAAAAAAVAAASYTAAAVSSSSSCSSPTSIAQQHAAAAAAAQVAAAAQPPSSSSSSSPPSSTSYYEHQQSQQHQQHNGAGGGHHHLAAMTAHGQN